MVSPPGRVLNQLLREICEERGFALREHCEGWVVNVETAERRLDVIGFNFGLNSAPASRIAEDKAATAAVLQSWRVPVIEHRLVLSPRLEGWVEESTSTWAAILTTFKDFGGDVVIKQIGGTGGANVMRARTVRALENASIKLFSRSHAITISPFLRLTEEFRCLIAPVDGCTEVVLLYSKARRAVRGDGRSALWALLATAAQTSASGQHDAVLEETGAPIRLDQVPDEGAIVILNWKHNLGQGAQPRVHLVHRAVDAGLAVSPHERAAEILELAQRAAVALDLRFGAVDVVAVAAAAGSACTLSVLEVNGGVMLENFAAATPAHRETAKRIYTLAVNQAPRRPRTCR